MKSTNKNSSLQAAVSELSGEFGQPRVKQAEPLAKYSTLRVGGPADIFFSAKTTQEIIKAVAIARKYNLQVVVFGGATNLLVADSGIRDLVIKNESHNIRIVGVSGAVHGATHKSGTAVVEADSGVLVNQLVRHTVDEGLMGLEHFLGQPGTVGGAMYINAHNMHKGVFFADCVLEASILTPQTEVKTVPVSYFRFGYDESEIQRTGDIVLSVKFLLRRGDKAMLWKDATAAMNYRRETQPLGWSSSGCTFRNFSKSDALRLHTPNYTTSVGYLIDRVGLKGYQIGNAKFSERHANFIVNLGSANASDILKLIKEAKKRIKKEFNIDLKEEVVLLG